MFFDTEGASLALARSSFTQEELVRRLVDIARDPDPRIALAGIDRLLRHVREIIELAGYTGSALVETTHSEGEGTVRRVASRDRVLIHRLVSEASRDSGFFAEHHPPNDQQQRQEPESLGGPPSLGESR